MAARSKQEPPEIALVIHGEKRLLSYGQAFAYGHGLCRAGHDAEADQLYDALARMKPSDRQPVIMRARCQAGLGNFDRCKELLDELLGPADAEAAQRLHGAFVFMQMGLHVEGAKELEHVVRKHPSLATGWLALGDAADSAGDPAKAAACWKQVVTRDRKGGAAACAARRQLARVRRERKE
jgi:thioredoxin-like negative regulator of GroEL